MVVPIFGCSVLFTITLSGAVMYVSRLALSRGATKRLTTTRTDV